MVRAKRQALLFLLFATLAGSAHAVAPSPFGRSQHAMAYDGARGRTVLFGGYGSSAYLGDTWEWDGNLWVERAPGAGPAARSAHAMAYDAARGRTVLFGGAGPSGYFADTWEWNGTTWSNITPAIQPPARVFHAMVYDGARQRVVLFGGYGPTGALADTWEWDGSAWIERSPTTRPPARDSHAMAFDSARGRVVVFGGYGASGPLADTWEWNGSTWAERTTASRPPARYAHALAYHGASGSTVLFGGYGVGGHLADMWEWNGSSWVQSFVPVPPGRYAHAMVYDGTRLRLVLFGGYGTTGALADTWEWDGVGWWNGGAWVEQRPPTVPPGRREHALTYDATRGRVVLFGGYRYGEPYRLGDTWEWVGGTWVERTPALSPAPRSHPAMVHDSARARVVLFGGYGTSGLLGDTWEWDGSSWVERAIGTGPGARAYHKMAYDSARGRVVLVGGPGEWDVAERSPLETWEWDGIQWVLRNTPTRPPPRRDHAIAYDSARRRVVLFGGYSPGVRYSDTWEWDGSTWVQRATGGPPARMWHAMTYDSARGRTVLYGGYAGEFLADTWEWDGSTWVERAVATSPPARWDHAMAYDAGRARVVLVGGGTWQPPPPFSDTWELLSCSGIERCNGVDDGNDGCFPPDEIDHDDDGYVGCAPWSGSDPNVLGGGDCEGADETAHPNAPEICDGLDTDCEGGAPAESDADGDGFRLCSGECDDARASVFPGAPQICDGLNNDCLDPAWPVPSEGLDGDGDGVALCAGDCNDGDPSIKPGGIESCNSIDDNCNALVDEDALGEDTDGDEVHNLCDNCRAVANPTQLDADADGAGDVCDNCPALSNADQADGDGELAREWAAAAVASSQYSSGDYSAMQAAGSPESVGTCQDVSTNWSPLGSTSDPEWLELSYYVPVRALGVDVHESFEERFVKQIELRDTSGAYHVLWSRADSTTCGDALEARWPLTDYLVDRVVVRTAAPSWEEIDAVALVGVFDAADGRGNACDNCPQHPNPSQADLDGDGAGNDCDCAVADPAVRPAAEVSGLLAESPGAGVIRLSWDVAAGASTYAIVRGELSALSATNLGECQVGGWPALEWDDTEVPQPGHGFAYLVRGESPICGPGTLGFGAYGLARFETGSVCP